MINTNNLKMEGIQMFIDVYNHILPRKYQESLEKKVPDRDMSLPSNTWYKTVPTLLDLEARFRIMDAFEGYIQVLTIASPPTCCGAPWEASSGERQSCPTCCSRTTLPRSSRPSRQTPLGRASPPSTAAGGS